MSNKIEIPGIATLKVELRVVRIGNKQMTKAVFNQLYEERIYDDKFNIIYPIWGKVFDGNEYIIFQKNNELRRMRIPSIERFMHKHNLYEFMRVRLKLMHQWQKLEPFYWITFFNEEGLEDFTIKIEKDIVYEYFEGHILIKGKEEELLNNILPEKYKNELVQRFNLLIEIESTKLQLINRLKNSEQLFIAV